jgi:hypothetical protein
LEFAGQDLPDEGLIIDDQDALVGSIQHVPVAYIVPFCIVKKTAEGL